MWTEEKLNEMLTAPSAALVEDIKKIKGDIMILGAGGKMGPTLCVLAKRAIEAAGVSKRVIAVSRFTDPIATAFLREQGVECIPCDLLDVAQLRALPEAENVIYMAGRKFGTQGCEDLTWAMNVLAPAYVADNFPDSRITVFSTGCVYPLVTAEEGGCTEEVRPEPVGEYSQSCLGRERIFEYAQRKHQNPMLFFRLNYSIDLRYGVLHDIALPIWKGEKVNNAVSHFNAIWQGSANEIALRSLGLAANPVALLNVTGPETVSTEEVAEEFGRLFGKKVEYMYPTAGKKGYLNNAGKMLDIFGKPAVTMQQMIKWQAEWIKSGGEDLNKPTHFEVNNGKF